MRFYHVTDGRTSGQPRYYGTLSEAHFAAKKFFDRFDVVITEEEVPTAKSDILRLLNDDGGFAVPLRKFVLTQRGGLKEGA